MFVCACMYACVCMCSSVRVFVYICMSLICHNANSYLLYLLIAFKNFSEILDTFSTDLIGRTSVFSHF